MKIFISILIVLLISSACFAETIILKSGKTITRKIVDKTDEYIKLDFEGISLLPILWLIYLISIIIGLFLFFKPALAIEIQRKFYEKINWRIEPISMQKELQHTKMMGMFLVVIAVLIGLYITKFRYF